MRRLPAFTIIELPIVIAILGILAVGRGCKEVANFYN